MFIHRADRNVALAVALDAGLISPVIARADTLSIGELAGERRRRLRHHRPACPLGDLADEQWAPAARS